jgi:ABC-type sugar transport system ATPase subunit
MLLDEPLVNLDYKLREELRDELSALFAAGDSTVVYATTEPTEALLLGGYTAVLDAGELLQYGPTAEVFHRPCSIRVARAFSDPPMNLVQARTVKGGVLLPNGQQLDLALPASGVAEGQTVTVGIRAGACVSSPVRAMCLCPAVSNWRRSRARTASCTCRRPLASWCRNCLACMCSRSVRKSPCT